MPGGPGVGSRSGAGGCSGWCSPTGWPMTSCHRNVGRIRSQGCPAPTNSTPSGPRRRPGPAPCLPRPWPAGSRRPATPRTCSAPWSFRRDPLQGAGQPSGAGGPAGERTLPPRPRDRSTLRRGAGRAVSQGTARRRPGRRRVPGHARCGRCDGGPGIERAGVTKMATTSSVSRSFPTLRYLAAPFRWFVRSRRRVWTAAALLLAMIVALPLWWSDPTGRPARHRRAVRRGSVPVARDPRRPQRLRALPAGSGPVEAGEPGDAGIPRQLDDPSGRRPIRNSGAGSRRIARRWSFIGGVRSGPTRWS